MFNLNLVSILMAESIGFWTVEDWDPRGGYDFLWSPDCCGEKSKKNHNILSFFFLHDSGCA